MQDKTFHFTNEISEPLSFDASKIHQVLVILLDNALKYTQAKDEIQLVAKQINPKWWQVVVRNTGSTIPDTQKKLIFERFYREEQSRNQETGGYGLGLAIAKQIVKNHHGKLFVSDWTNQGVQFTLQLPIIPKNLHTEKN